MGIHQGSSESSQRPILDKLYECSGFPTAIRECRTAWYERLTYRFKLGTCFSKVEVRTNGSIQGCLFSLDDCKLTARHTFACRRQERRWSLRRMARDEAEGVGEEAREETGDTRAVEVGSGEVET